MGNNPDEKIFQSRRQIVDVTEIKEAPYNPRKDLRPGDVEYEKLKKSIDDFGLVEDLVWNIRTGNLVGGHQRFKVLKAKGATKIEVNVVDLDDKKERALNIALNKISGDWDQKKLKEILVELDDGAFDIESTGFLMPEIEELMAEGVEPGDEGNAGPKYPAMELQPYEHYDYVVLLFTNSMDFLNVVELLGLRKVELRAGGKNKVGVARALDGMKAIKMIMEAAKNQP